MELASPFPDEPVIQIEADVRIEPVSLQAESADLEIELHSYERPLAVSPFGTPEHVPDWHETRTMSLCTRPRSQVGKWIRIDLGPVTRDIETCFLHRIQPWVACFFLVGPPVCMPLLLPSGGGVPILFKNWYLCAQCSGHTNTAIHQHFIENAEKECGDEGSELDAKHARQDSVKALRKLVEDFESQLQVQGEVERVIESSNDSEEELPDDLPEQPEHTVGCSSSVTILAQEQEENLISREPQPYLCDDWTRPVEVMRSQPTPTLKMT